MCAASGRTATSAPRGPGPEVGGRCGCPRRHRDPGGAGHRALRRRPRRRREGQEGHADGPGHRRPGPQRRAAGVVDPPREHRDAGLLHQRPRRGAGRHEPRVGRSASCGSTPRTSSSPTRCCAWTCRRRAPPARWWAWRRHRDVAGAAAARVRQERVKAPGTPHQRCADPSHARRLARHRRHVRGARSAFGIEDLRGKTVVTAAISDERLADLGARMSTWCSTARPSRSTSPSTRRCSRR
jgi:hypothetical protein